MSFKVGITGGIGSGKTTVTKIFETLGIPIYYADDAAKRLMNEDAAIKTQLVQHFGAATYKDGLLDRSYLSAQVFGDKEKLELLNSIVHPVTIADAASWMQQQTAPYAIKEAALIFESGMQKELDYVIGVYAPVALRIFRSMKRDGSSKEKVLARMNQQMDEDIKMKLCDTVITNDERQAVLPQVMLLHQKLLKML
jgi:dephospho-CoA kinase